MILFCFNDTATTEIYTLSLHDALPIFAPRDHEHRVAAPDGVRDERVLGLQIENVELVDARRDRKSTRLNSSHANISYAVFCLKKTTTATSPALPSTFQTSAAVSSASSY